MSRLFAPEDPSQIKIQRNKYNTKYLFYVTSTPASIGKSAYHQVFLYFKYFNSQLFLNDSHLLCVI